MKHDPLVWNEQMKKYFRLPNGQPTISVKRYIDAWRKLSKPIARATNSRAFGYDPDIAFVTKDKKYGHVLEMVANSMANVSECKHLE